MLALLASVDTAKVCYLIACILLAIIGVLMCVLSGLAWIGVAVIALGLWNSITP